MMTKDKMCWTMYGRRMHLVHDPELRLTWCWAMYDETEDDLTEHDDRPSEPCKNCMRESGWDGSW